MIVLAELVLSPIALDTILIMSILLGIIGPLYLAYDLFGRENGPLRWFTLVITCGLVSASVLGIVGSILNQVVKGSFDLNFTLQALLMGTLMGMLTVILIDLPKPKAKPPLFSRRGSLLGLALGFIFWFVVYFALQLDSPTALAVGLTCAVFTSIWQRITWMPSLASSELLVSTNSPAVQGMTDGVATIAPSWKPAQAKPHIFSRKGLLLGLGFGSIIWFPYFFIASRDIVASLLASLPLVLICGVLLSTWRFLNWEAPHSKPHIFALKGSLLGFVVGFVPWLVFQTVSNYTVEPVSGPVAGLQLMLEVVLTLFLIVGPFALANAAAGSIAQYILWKANQLPHRLLGVIGIVFIVCASSLQGIPLVIDLLNHLQVK